MEIFWLVLIGLVSYVFGSFSIARLVSGKKMEDWGRDSWGTMSTLQKTGSKAKGALVLLGDALKGFLPIYFSVSLISAGSYSEFWTLVVSSFFVVLGHNHSLFLRFRGGRGLATGFGVLLAVNWFLGLACLGTLLFSIFATELWMRGSFRGGFLKLARNNLLGRAVGIVVSLAVIYAFCGLHGFLALLPMMMLIIFSHKERVMIFVSENKDILLRRLGVKNSR